MKHTHNAISSPAHSIARLLSGVVVAGTCLAMGAASAQAQAEPAASAKAVVTAFFDLAFVQGKPAEAALRYISPSQYIQHNPMVADGREAFLKVVPGWVQATGQRATVKRVIAENDLVVIHASSTVPGKKGAPTQAVTDIFRVENGLIVEHWDVIQAVPEKSANKNSMF